MAANIEQEEDDVCRQPRRSIVLHITLKLFIKDLLSHHHSSPVWRLAD